MSNIFSDIDLKFKPHPITNRVANVSNEISIRRALTTLFFTRQGEKLYDNDFGIGIQEHLFEINDSFNRDSLNSFIQTQINNYEPRINVLDFFIENKLHNAEINLKYSLKSRPQEILTYQKTIRRIR